MRRLVLVITALVAVAAAATAYAASINTYKVSFSFTSKKAGTPAKPAPIGYTQDITAKSGTPGNRTGILLDLKTTIYGVKADGKHFPTCSAATINTKPFDVACPKKAEVASGFIKAQLGDPKNFATTGTECDPALDVWNAGQGKLLFFFRTTPTHACGGLQTGSTPAYPGTYKQQGKNLVVDVPIPDTVNYPVGKTGGVVGSLSFEHLKWFKSTIKKGGKTYAALSSVGCKGKKRPFSMKFTATLPGQANQMGSTSGSAPCS